MVPSVPLKPISSAIRACPMAPSVPLAREQHLTVTLREPHPCDNDGVGRAQPLDELTIQLTKVRLDVLVFDDDADTMTEASAMRIRTGERGRDAV